VGLLSKIIKGAGLKREEIKKGADMAKVSKAAAKNKAAKVAVDKKKQAKKPSPAKSTKTASKTRVTAKTKTVAKPAKKTAPAKTTKVAKKPAKAVAKKVTPAKEKAKAPGKTSAKKATPKISKKTAKPVSAKKPAPKAAASKAKAASHKVKPAIQPKTNTKKPISKTPAKVNTPVKASQPKNKNLKPSPVKTPKRAPGDGPASVTPYNTRKGENYMNEAQLAHFVNILTKWKMELMTEVDRTVHHMKDESQNLPDPNDRASQEEEFSLELRTRDRERKLIRKIDKTLEAITNKEYGYCEDCGIEIGIKRLEARPTATQCIDCKTLSELKEKQTLL